MPWLGTLLLALAMVGVSWFVYTLTANLSHQPEYSPAMTNLMRAIGYLIAGLGTLFALVLLGFAGLAYLG